MRETTKLLKYRIKKSSVFETHLVLDLDMKGEVTIKSQGEEQRNSISASAIIIIVIAAGIIILIPVIIWIVRKVRNSRQQMIRMHYPLVGQEVECTQGQQVTIGK